MEGQERIEENVINVCTIRKGDWKELDITYKKELRTKIFHGRQSSRK